MSRCRFCRVDALADIGSADVPSMALQLRLAIRICQSNSKHSTPLVAVYRVPQTSNVRNAPFSARYRCGYMYC